MLKKITATLIIFTLGIFAGNAITRYMEIKNLWDSQRSGLMDLNRIMAKDKTRRLGIAIVTEQDTYIVQSLDPNVAQLQAFFISTNGKDEE